LFIPQWQAEGYASHREWLVGRSKIQDDRLREFMDGVEAAPELPLLRTTRSRSVWTVSGGLPGLGRRR
jgi:hypothetical protein